MTSGLLLAGALHAAESVQLDILRDGRGGAMAQVRNTLAGPVDVTLHGDSDGGDPLPKREQLAAGEVRGLARTGSQPALRLEVVPGNPLLLPPPPPTLGWPLAMEAGFRISQGFGGQSSHRTPENWHAIDIAVAEGNEVLAAQAGVVMEVIDQHEGAGTTPEWRDRANRIRVLAADGCMVVYAHLQARSSRVQPGQAVRLGEPLARSGHTGWSTSPHLHLGRQCNLGGELLSAPFQLRGPAGLIETQDPSR